MDRNYYYEKIAKQREREIAHQLANNKLLKDGRHVPLTSKQARRLILRIGSAIIVFYLLALYLIT